MARVFNFSAGPAVLPESVLREAAAEMLDYRGTGMSVMEMSHRSKAFQSIIDQAEADLRKLMGIPDNYKVLFLQGGASQQFAMIPMNLMKNRVADYIVTGQWAKKAWQEAKLYGQANAVASSADRTFSYIPDCSDLPISENADYVYICENNTIYGTKFWTLPNTKGKPLVSDISSCFLSEPVDVTKYGMLYGGVQKNVGPAGVVIAIIREDLITEDVLPGTPTMLRYKIHADNGSMYNTPPTYGIYICGKVFQWLLNMVENLLTVTRIKDQETDRVKKSPEIVEEVVSEAILRLRKRLPDIKIRVNMPETFLMLSMDPTLIEQVLINLLENACIHSGSSAPIDLTIRDLTDSVSFQVKDYGRGIDEEQLPYIFEGQQRTSATADGHKGIGIGLSICKTIIRAHGGTITAANHEHGAEFTFTLPKEKEDQINV